MLGLVHLDEEEETRAPSLHQVRAPQEGSHLQARKWVLTRDLDPGLPASITVRISVCSVGGLVDSILLEQPKQTETALLHGGVSYPEAEVSKCCSSLLTFLPSHRGQDAQLLCSPHS